MKTIWLLGLLSLLGLTGLSAQTPDDNLLPGLEPGISDELEPAMFERLIFAQAQGDKPPMRGDGRPWRGMEQRHQRKQLEQLRMLKMLELLELREDQEIPFLTTFNAMRKEQRQLEETSHFITDSLAQELRDGNASEARLNDLVDRVLSLQHEKHQKIIEFIEQSRTLLTAEQVGKLVIFQKRFESEILERIGRFRKGMGPGPRELPEDDG